jgi:hypothetical protein
MKIVEVVKVTPALKTGHQVTSHKQTFSNFFSSLYILNS